MFLDLSASRQLLRNSKNVPGPIRSRLAHIRTRKMFSELSHLPEYLTSRRKPKNILGAILSRPWAATGKLLLPTNLQVREARQHLKWRNCSGQFLRNQLDPVRRAVPEKTRSMLQMPDEAWIEPHQSCTRE